MKKHVSKIIILLLVVEILSIPASAINAKNFTDYDSINPDYLEAITYVTDKGILSGYADGAYKPSYILTRGAAAKIISAMALGADKAKSLSANTAPFSDVSKDYLFSGYIAYCTSNKYISGYADGTFRPADALTVAAFSKLLLNYMGFSADATRYTGPNWRVNVYQDAISAGLFTDDAGFEMTDYVTREKAAFMAYNAIMYIAENGVPQQTITQPVLSSAFEIAEYLQENFSSVATTVGTANFSFMVFQNTSEYSPYDYQIFIDMDRELFDRFSSISYTIEQISAAKLILKEHTRSIANSLISIIPSEKFLCSYRYYYYDL